MFRLKSRNGLPWMFNVGVSLLITLQLLPKFPSRKGKFFLWHRTPIEDLCRRPPKWEK